MANESKIRGESRSRTKPTPGSQGEQVNVRTSQYGEVYTRPLDRHSMAEEGSYFIAHNTTNDASTTLAGHAAPVLADADDTLTKPFVFVRVPNAATKLVQLDFIEIEVVTAGALGTQACWAAQLDTGTTRLSSGGTALTIVNPNMQSAETSILAVTNHLLGGAPVVGAETASCRVLGFGTLRPSIEIAGDIKMFTFGRDPAVVGTQAGQAAAAIRTSVVALPPVLLGATDCFLLALHGQASQNAAGVYKLRMGWSERTAT
jgi:hypothetical protein